MSYSLNSLRGVILETILGFVKRDTRSLDDSSYNPLYNPSVHFIFHVLFHLILHYCG